jgi:hypothetical protein
MPGTCNERSIDLSVSATGFSPIEAYSQTDRRTPADFSILIRAKGRQPRNKFIVGRRVPRAAQDKCGAKEWPMARFTSVTKSP